MRSSSIAEEPRDRQHLHLELSLRIAASPEEVFACLADVQQVAVRPGSPVISMTKIPDGPTGVGTQWREVLRLGPAMRLAVWTEVTGWEPPRRIAEVFGSRAFRGVLIYRLEGDEHGTLLHQTQTLELVRLLRPWSGMARRTLMQRLPRRLHVLRDQIEQSTPAG
jgi:hypothetical protein